MDPRAPDQLRPPKATAIDDEAKLLSRVAAGDMRAFESLYRCYYRRLTRFLEQVTRRRHVVDDVLDDTMMVVWLKAGSFNGSSRVSTWIFAIAYNKAMKALRQLGEPVHALPDNDAPGWTESPESELMKRQATLGVERLLARLSPEQRAVIELTYYYGYAYREIADIVGCPVDTVKTRMFHARRKLRVMLAQRGQQEV